DGPERLRFLRIGNAKVPLPAVAAGDPDEMAEIAGGDVCIARAVPSQPFEEKLQHRLGADRHERLWQYCGIGPKPRPLAARLNHSLHLFLRCVTSAFARLKIAARIFFL